MRGSMVKEASSYYVTIELDVDPLTGRRCRNGTRGTKTKREADVQHRSPRISRRAPRRAECARPPAGARVGG